MLNEDKTSTIEEITSIPIIKSFLKKVDEMYCEIKEELTLNHDEQIAIINLINKMIETGSINKELQNAYECYERRQERKEHPVGSFDNKGRWSISEEEICECCDLSKKNKTLLNKHCRTSEHIANLFQVDYQELIDFIKEKKKTTAINKNTKN